MTEADPVSEDLLPEPLAAGPGLFGDAPEPAMPGVPAPYRVLARAYRPARFEDLIGQDAMVRILRRAFATGRIAHAFMLTGVRGTGKTTTARIIARCLNCTGADGKGGPTADPCGICPNCRAIMADRHPDVIEMDAASRTGVDDVREIIEATRFRPMEARVKVFIIDEVHMLSRNAFNALLKTLEEPPPHVKFVFATTELRKVPITVLSRCQKFDLRRVPAAELAAHFGRIAAQEGVAIAPEALDLIARAADGSVRDGLSLLDQAIVMGTVEGGSIAVEAVADMLGLADQGLVFDLFEHLMAGRAPQVLAMLDQAHERGADAGLVLQDLLALTHLLSRLKASPDLRESADLPQLQRLRGVELTEALSLPVLGRAWQMLLKGVSEVEQAPDRRAAAEMVLIRLCYLADQPTPGDLVRRLAGQGEIARPAAAPESGPIPGGSGGARAIAGGGGAMLRAVAMASAPEMAPATAAETAILPQTREEAPQFEPAPGSFREVISLVRDRHEMTLYGHLLHSVHLVRYAPPVIDIRPEPDAPRDLASRLAGLLSEATGQRWTIALSSLEGEPTIDQQRQAADLQREEEATEHPLVRAIMEAFPGARLQSVRDPLADEYRLPPVAATATDGEEESGDADDLLLSDDMPEFAPPDAEFIDEMDMENDR
ncbi:MAG TPA: DNA polymerase III subunit gamma/tau [Acidisoma sp.]|uniref:DNA polymerase III subunit gamma/tau n=1 Tax=Acidisoma sp. TaxID=1872115 RepID=UPI002C6D906D|nr:DNA polymerase III subunit gamma/tau [Acidisoma sp.]HTI03086.1 DNA polymerase III subunit gamma/tau [Acidisoma sp.]